jgi:nucleoside-diphosphate-sugar epimerase
MKGKSLPITGDGSETRDFTYVLDLIQGLIKAGYYDSAVGENFNLAAGKEITIKEMSEAVNKVTKNSSPFIFNPRRKWDTKPRLLASIEKARNLIHYEPIINFDEGFLNNVEWFKDNWEDIERLSDFKPGMNSAVRKKI